MRLPPFDLASPTTVAEAAELLAHPSAVLVGGGTDLFPKMKRRQLTPEVVVSLAGVKDLAGIRAEPGGGCVIGAGTTLAEVVSSSVVPPAIAAAAESIASPQIRNTATVGGNLCLDTRCNYIDMPELWRSASGHCLKDGGDTCWVAPRSNHCWAISSTDLAPVAVALDATVRLVGPEGERLIPAASLYRNDGIDYLTRAPNEILAELVIPPPSGRATYLKLRRRGSIDFPLVGVAAVIRLGSDGLCEHARLVIGGVASAPVRSVEAEEFLVGESLTDEVIEEVAQLASKPIRPQDNTDTGSRYRKWMIPVQVSRALSELAGPNPEERKPNGTP